MCRKNAKFIKMLAVCGAVVMLCVSLGGCGFFPKSTSIDHLAIVSALAVDSHAEGVQLTVVINEFEAEGQGGEEQSSQSGVLCAIAPSLAQALDALQMQSDRQIFLGLADYYLFGESTRQDLYKYVDFLSREISLKVSSAVFFVEGNAQEFVNNHYKDYNLHDRLQNLTQNPKFAQKPYALSFLQFLGALQNPQTAVAVPCLQGINSEQAQNKEAFGGQNAEQGGQKASPDTKNSATQDILLKYAIVQQHKPAFFLDANHNLGLNFACGDSDYLCFFVRDDVGNKLVFKTSKIRRKIKVQLKDEKVFANLDIKCDVTLVETHSDWDVTDMQIKQLVMDKISEYVAQEVRDCVDIAQQNYADFLGIGAKVAQKYAQRWEQMDYLKEFGQAEVSINVSPSIKRAYNLRKPLSQ